MPTSPLNVRVPNADVARVWFVGPAAREALPDLLAHLTALGTDPVDVTRGEVLATALGTACAAVNTAPLLGTRRVLVATVRGEVSQTVWAKRLLALPPSACLVLCVDKAPRRVLKRLVEVGAILPALTEADLALYVQHLVAEAGYRLTGAAAKLLVTRYPSRARLEAEVFRLTSDPEHRVIADRSLPPSPPVLDPYRLWHHLVRHRTGSFLQAVAPWLLRGEADRVLDGLSARLRAYLAIRWATSATDLDLVKLLRAPPDVVAQWRRQAESFPLDVLQRWLATVTQGVVMEQAAVETVFALVAQRLSRRGVVLLLGGAS